MSVTDTAAPRQPARASQHRSFLVYQRFRYLKLATLLVVLSIVIYIIDKPYGSRYGGSWAGYTLGTVGALLILWLTWFGYRKRTYTRYTGNLAARLSAHVYLGLALVIIATLHTGFHFGWNVHTLAYALMCLVIASGVYGVFAYSRYPELMTANRHSTTTDQMLSKLAGLNEELRTAALSLDDRSAALVRRSIEDTEVGGSAWRQLSGRHPNCATAAALAQMTQPGAARAAETEIVTQSASRQVRLLLNEKSMLLGQLRRDLKYKAMMDIWLYFHVPVSFGLLAALLAHVISVFMLW